MDTSKISPLSTQAEKAAFFAERAKLAGKKTYDVSLNDEIRGNKTIYIAYEWTINELGHNCVTWTVERRGKARALAACKAHEPVRLV